MGPPSGPKKSLTPVDYFGLVEHSVIRDPQFWIKAIKSYPNFAEGFIRGSMELVFSDQGDFHCITEQAGLFLALCSAKEMIDRSGLKPFGSLKHFCTFMDAILKIIKDNRAAQAAHDHANENLLCLHQDKKREECHAHEADCDSDVEMTNVDLLLILDHLDNLTLSVAKLKSGTEDSPSPKKPKVSPSISSYCPGNSFALSLVKDMDTMLETSGKVSKEMLKDYLVVLEQAACQQLFTLDIAQQICKQLVDHHEAVRAALYDQDLEKAGFLIRDLQVSKDCLKDLKPISSDDAADMEISGPSSSRIDAINAAIEEAI
ncbi:hypothetical protein DXG01_002048 [Tephrocybe rancida]|nr:hypothetical protein DXG01_002048 [Tephrocybe rancida]